MTDTDAFAHRMKRDLQAFMDDRSPDKRPRRPVQRPTPPKTKDVLVVKLSVKKPYGISEAFYHFSDRLSQLEAEFEAKRAAESEGYIFEHVIYIKRGTTAR